jgi:hypothetical protein
MHAVAEACGFSEDATEAGMTEEELERLINRLAATPQTGDMVPGTGGVRKVRVGGRGKGRSGGFRVLSYYAGEDLPVFLIAVFSKGDRADLSASDRAVIKKELAGLARDYRKGQREWARQLTKSWRTSAPLAQPFAVRELMLYTRIFSRRSTSVRYGTGLA